MYKGLTRFLKADEGVTAIEFAMLAPPLIFLLLGIIEYAIIFHLQSLATHAGNEAARMGKTGAQYCATGVDKRACIEQAIHKVMGSWITDARPLSTSVQSFGNFGAVRTSTGLNGMGRGGEVVLYQSSLKWRPITPFLFNGIAENGAITIAAFALIKNEDF